MEKAFPPCRKCEEGDLVPLSQFGPLGASLRYKAWVCTNPACLYNTKIDHGEILREEPVCDGSHHKTVF
jgi:hypothetical protein